MSKAHNVSFIATREPSVNTTSSTETAALRRKASVIPAIVFVTVTAAAGCGHAECRDRQIPAAASTFATEPAGCQARRTAGLPDIRERRG